MNDNYKTWNSFSLDFSGKYLRGIYTPSESSKEILVDILKNECKNKKISILEVGCGSGKLYDYFKTLNCTFTGVDISVSLLDVAKQIHGSDTNAEFILDDANNLEKITKKYDFAIYSHVIEILSSPEKSLLKTKTLANKIIIRFFAPPDFKADEVELKEMDVGDGKKVPYIRRKMSRDYYRLILTKMRCTKVDVHCDFFSKDQIHVLHY